jgi:hypothetical protein
MTKQLRREVRIREDHTHEDHEHETPIGVGDHVRAKTTQRTGEVTQVVNNGAGEQVTISYDEAPQDTYLTTPAREGVELPRALVDPV